MDSLSFCRTALGEVSRTFAIPISMLRPRLEATVTCGYLLCRILDTVEDEPGLSLATRDRLYAAFLQVLEIEPTHARAVRSLAASCEELGQDEQALEQWARYLELAPGATDAEEVSQKLRSAGKL